MKFGLFFTGIARVVLPPPGFKVIFRKKDTQI